MGAVVRLGREQRRRGRTAAIDDGLVGVSRDLIRLVVIRERRDARVTRSGEAPLTCDRRDRRDPCRRDPCRRDPCRRDRRRRDRRPSAAPSAAPAAASSAAAPAAAPLGLLLPRRRLPAREELLDALPVGEVLARAVGSDHHVASAVVLRVRADLEALDPAPDLFLSLRVRVPEARLDDHALVIVHVLVHGHGVEEPREILDHLVRAVERLRAELHGRPHLLLNLRLLLAGLIPALGVLLRLALLANLRLLRFGLLDGSLLGLRFVLSHVPSRVRHRVTLRRSDWIGCAPADCC